MLKLSDSFYEDEVREGFYVPAAVKQAWGAELIVLSEIDKICRKHKIPYFLEWGSLLGAVRHGGFIPWDDDFDIGMLRCDFEKFYDAALKELPDEFDIINYKTHENHIYFLSNVVGKSRICFEKEHLENFHGFPYVCGIDIFILDYVYEDSEKETDRKNRAKYLLATADYIYSENLTPAQREGIIQEAENRYRIKVPRNLEGIDLRIYLYSQIEKIFDEASGSDSHTLTQMVSRGLKEKNKYLLPEINFKNIVEVPFEGITLPVSYAYESVLCKKYGNFMRLIKSGGGHDYPFFDGQRRNFEETTGMKVPGYMPTDDIINQKSVRDKSNGNSDTYKNLCQESLNEISEAIRLCGKDDFDKYIILPQVQQSVIALGEFVEKIKGENYCVIRKLEELCEEIFQFYNCDNDEDGKFSEKCLKCIDTVSAEIESRKEVVFLPFKAAYWKAMKNEYEMATNDPDCDVYVVPIPYYYKNYDGTLRDVQYHPEEYPDKLVSYRYDEFDFALHHPDVIVIQNPYDAYNETTSIAPFFYSHNIVNYCNELKYIPWFCVDEFTEDNFRAYRNMDYYVIAPGVMNADTVVVQSDNMKQLYIEKLCRALGEKNRGYFAEKIKVEKMMTCEHKDNEKIILYMVDFACIIEHPDKAIEKIKKVIETLKEAACSGGLKVIWHEQPTLTIYLPQKNPELFNEYAAIRDTYIQEGWGEYDSFADVLKENEEYVPMYREHLGKLVEKCSSYYGDPGWVAHLFRNAGKPVMLQDYEL